MEKRVAFGVSSTMTVENEVIKGFLLDIDARNAADDTTVNIADLNQIGIDIILKRKGRKDFFIFNGYLEDLLVGVFAQTTRMQLAKKKLGSGYKVALDLGMVVSCFNGTSIEIKLSPQQAAFTSLSKNTSGITIESMPAIGADTMIPQIKVHGFEVGNLNFDKNLGNNIMKITFANDDANSYDTTSQPKVASMSLTAVNFDKDVSENLLIAENMNYLDNNPETDVQHLVLHQDTYLLDNVNLKMKLDKAATNTTRVITVGFHEA